MVWGWRIERTGFCFLGGFQPVLREGHPKTMFQLWCLELLARAGGSGP